MAVPARMTGGVDRTATTLQPDEDDVLVRSDNIPRVVGKSESGSVDGVTLEDGVHLAADADGNPDSPSAAGYDNAQWPSEAQDTNTPNDEIDPGIIKQITKSDGTPVRIVVPNRFRTQRYTITPGQAFLVAQANPRRTALAVSITAPAGAQVGYLGNDVGTCAAVGFALITNDNGGPSYMTLTHGDQVAFAADSANTENIVLSVAYEALD